MNLARVVWPSMDGPRTIPVRLGRVLFWSGAVLAGLIVATALAIAVTSTGSDVWGPVIVAQCAAAPTQRTLGDKLGQSGWDSAWDDHFVAICVCASYSYRERYKIPKSLLMHYKNSAVIRLLHAHV